LGKYRLKILKNTANIIGITDIISIAYIFSLKISISCWYRKTDINPSLIENDHCLSHWNFYLVMETTHSLLTDQKLTYKLCVEQIRSFKYNVIRIFITFSSKCLYTV